MANARLGWFSPLGLAASIRVAVRRVGLRAHCFRFSARTASEWPLGEFVLPPSASEIPLGGLAFGLTASAFRRAPHRRLPSAGWPSGSLFPLFGMRRFGVAAGRVRSSAFRFGDSARRVGLRVHCFRFSACTDSELPSAGWPSGSLLPIFGTRRFGVAAGRLAFGLIASEIAIWRVGLWAHRFGNSARRVGLRVHCFRFSARTDSEWLLGEFVLPPSVSEIVLGGLVFGLTASAFRHAPLRSGRRASSFFRLPFRRLSSAGWPSGSPLPLFGMHRFGDCRWAGWPSGSLLPLFGMRRFGVAAGRVGLRAHCFRFSACADPHRRSEDRRSTTTRQLFHFKTLIPTC